MSTKAKNKGQQNNRWRGIFYIAVISPSASIS